MDVCQEICAGQSETWWLWVWRMFSLPKSYHTSLPHPDGRQMPHIIHIIVNYLRWPHAWKGVIHVKVIGWHLTYQSLLSLRLRKWGCQKPKCQYPFLALIASLCTTCVTSIQIVSKAPSLSPVETAYTLEAHIILVYRPEPIFPWLPIGLLLGYCRTQPTPLAPPCCWSPWSPQMMGKAWLPACPPVNTHLSKTFSLNRRIGQRLISGEEIVFSCDDGFSLGHSSHQILSRNNHQFGRYALAFLLTMSL